MFVGISVAHTNYITLQAMRRPPLERKGARPHTLIKLLHLRAAGQTNEILKLNMRRLLCCDGMQQILENGTKATLTSKAAAQASSAKESAFWFRSRAWKLAKLSSK